MRRLFLAATMCAGLSAVLRSQEPPPDFQQYCEAVRLYASGRAEAAMVAIEAWPAANLRRAAPLTARCTGPASLALAALLITDLAVHKQGDSPSQVAQYLNAAEPAVTLVKPDDLRVHTPAGIARFQADWWATAGRLMLAWTDPELASRFIDHALHLFSDSATLHTLAGMAAEMRTHLRNANLHDRVMVDAAQRLNWRAQFVAAENEYRRAIALDANAVAARVHLGRVLYLAKNIKEARTVLASVDASAPSALRYLAHLFLGAVAEFEYDTAEARREYEAALAVQPAAQTAYIALSFVERVSGHEERARQLLKTWAERPASEDLDPFSAYQNGSFDLDLIDQLRGQIAR